MKPRKHSITWRYNDKLYTGKLMLTDKIEVVTAAEAEEPSKGLGDTVKKVIEKVSRGKVKPCGGCKKRQAALNKVMPYKGAADGR